MHVISSPYYHLQAGAKEPAEREFGGLVLCFTFYALRSTARLFLYAMFPRFSRLPQASTIFTCTVLVLVLVLLRAFA